MEGDGVSLLNLLKGGRFIVDYASDRKGGLHTSAEHHHRPVTGQHGRCNQKDIGKKDDGTVIGVSDAKKLMEDIPNKIQNKLGIVADVNLLAENGLEYIEMFQNVHSSASVLWCNRFILKIYVILCINLDIGQLSDIEILPGIGHCILCGLDKLRGNGQCVVGVPVALSIAV